MRLRKKGKPRLQNLDAARRIRLPVVSITTMPRCATTWRGLPRSEQNLIRRSVLADVLANAPRWSLVEQWVSQPSEWVTRYALEQKQKLQLKPKYESNLNGHRVEYIVDTASDKCVRITIVKIVLERNYIIRQICADIRCLAKRYE